MPTPALVATLNVWTGETIWWGTPGFRMVSVADAVYASCAMPGLLPPGRVGGTLCMDGGVLDPLGLHGLYGMVDQIVVVELGHQHGAVCDPKAPPEGASLWWGAQTLVMRDLTRHLLRNWDGSPMQVIRPQLRGVEVLKVEDPERVIRAGYEAAWSRLGNDDSEEAGSRVKPRLG
jgi:NTE family protein